ncbi:MAG: Calx-beta domain-containing protein [Actinomycetota bacterium]
MTTTSELLAAVTEANGCDGAQTITLAAGTYDPGALTLTDSVTLRGVDPTSRPVLSYDGSLPGAFGPGAVFVQDNERGNISGETFAFHDIDFVQDGDGRSQMMRIWNNDLELTNVSIQGKSPDNTNLGFGVRVINGNATVDNVSIDSVRGTGVWVDGSLTGSDLTVTNTGSSGVDLGPPDTGDPAIDITGFEVADVGLASTSSDGITIGGSVTGSITNLDLRSGPRDGLFVSDPRGLTVETATIGGTDAADGFDGNGIDTGSSTTSMSLTEATISGNDVGIDTEGRIDLDEVDITNNRVGLDVTERATSELRVVDVTGNAGGDCRFGRGGGIVDLGGNTDSDDSCGFSTAPLLEDRTLDVTVEFVGPASEEIAFGATIDVTGADQVTESAPLDIDGTWPLAGSDCGGFLSDWFEFTRPTCSASFDLRVPVGGELTLDAEALGDFDRVLFSGDCTAVDPDDLGAPTAVVDVTSAATCHLAVARLSSTVSDGTGAVVQISQRWIGDPDGAPTPAVRVEPATSAGGGVDIGLDEPIPARQCRPPGPTESANDVLDECRSETLPCPVGEVGCETFTNIDVGAGDELVVSVAPATGWLSTLSGDCAADGTTVALTNGDLLRCEIVHVQTSQPAAVAVEWTINNDLDVFGPLGPRREIDVEVDIGAPGGPVVDSIPYDPFPPQDQQDLNCSQPSFPNADLPATCRTVIGLDTGETTIAFENQFEVFFALDDIDGCAVRTIDLDAGDLVTCRVDLTPQPPAFATDPAPRVVAEGSGPTPTRIAVDLIFDTPTPPGYAVETVGLTTGVYDVDTAGELQQGRLADVVGASGLETLPTGTTASTVWVDIDADTVPESPDAGLIVQIEEVDTGRRVRIHVTVVDDDEATTVTAQFTDGPLPLANRFDFDAGSDDPVSFVWTLARAGLSDTVFTTSDPQLDIVQVDEGLNTLSVYGVRADGSLTATASAEVTVEPTTLQLATTSAQEGDTFAPADSEPFVATGTLARNVDLDVVLSDADPLPTNAVRADVSTACFGNADVAFTDDEVRVGGIPRPLAIVACADDDIERDQVVALELVEPSTGAVILDALLTIVDDDRYDIAPILVREGGVSENPVLGVPQYSSVSNIIDIDVSTPAWYDDAPVRYELIDRNPVTGTCSRGIFDADNGASVGLSTTPPLNLTNSVARESGEPAPRLVVCGDSRIEGSSFLTLEVEAPDGSVDRAQVIVADDDVPPAIITTSLLFDEPTGVSAAIIKATIDLEPATFPRQVVATWLGVTDGAAAGACINGSVLPADFEVAPPKLIDIPAGASSIDIPIRVCANTISDPDGGLVLALSVPPSTPDEVLNPIDVAVIPAAIADVQAPRVAATGVKIDEGDSGTSMATITLVASGVGKVGVEYQTLGVTAQPGSDFVETSGSIPLTDAPWVRQIEVPIVGDVIDENDERLLVALQSSQALIDPTVQIEIVDDDVVSLIVDDIDVAEGEPANVAVRLSNPSDRPIGVGWETVDGTASSPSDYVADAGGFVFAPGETIEVLEVDTVDGEPLEFDESFQIFAAADGGLTATGEVTIINDGLPEIVGGTDIIIAVPSGTTRPTEVTWFLDAVDERDGPLPVGCDPTSGAGFTVGRTPVNCTATDSRGNQTTAVFDVIVSEFQGIFVGLPGGDQQRRFQPGAQVEFTGLGFDPGRRTIVELRSDPVVLGTFVADDTGSVDARVVIPADTPAGEHTLAMFDAGDTSRQVLVTIEVGPDAPTTPAAPPAAPPIDDEPGTGTPPGNPTIPPGGLPATGVTTTVIGGLAAALLAVGAVLAATGRRRSTRRLRRLPPNG